MVVPVDDSRLCVLDKAEPDARGEMARWNVASFAGESSVGYVLGDPKLSCRPPSRSISTIPLSSSVEFAELRRAPSPGNAARLLLLRSFEGFCAAEASIDMTHPPLNPCSSAMATAWAAWTSARVGKSIAAAGGGRLTRFRRDDEPPPGEAEGGESRPSCDDAKLVLCEL